LICDSKKGLTDQGTDQGLTLKTLRLTEDYVLQTGRHTAMDRHDRVNCFDFIELPVKDINTLNQTKEFYNKVFGWSYADWGDDYSDTQNSGLGSGLNADPSHRPNYPLAVIYTEDLEGLREKVCESNGVIIREIFSFPGGRRFHFADTAGNELAVWTDK
jgi:uncharacterized protein